MLNKLIDFVPLLLLGVIFGLGATLLSKVVNFTLFESFVVLILFAILVKLYEINGR